MSGSRKALATTAVLCLLAAVGAYLIAREQDRIRSLYGDAPQTISLAQLAENGGMATGLSARFQHSTKGGAAGVSLKDLPDFNLRPDNYKVDPYIAVAVKLQAAGKEKARHLLVTLAQDPDHGEKVIVLCRMVFSPKPNGKFRRPLIGAAWFLGGTDYPDWPLEPIELVDGVPFLITRGYFLAGEPESAESYLRYCLKDCEWRGERFQPKGDREKRKALEKLVASPKWKVPLTEEHKQFLTSQIR